MSETPPIQCCLACYQMFAPPMLVDNVCAACWKEKAEEMKRLAEKREDGLSRANLTSGHLLKDRDHLRAENERLREALEKIVGDMAVRALDAESNNPMAYRLSQIAQQALAKRKDRDE